jgi:hypothetical protein
MAMHLLASLYKLKDSQTKLRAEIKARIVHLDQLEPEFRLVKIARISLSNNLKISLKLQGDPAKA